MVIDDYLRIARVAVETAVLVSAPVLVLGLVAGLAVSIFQEFLYEPTDTPLILRFLCLFIYFLVKKSELTTN